MKKRVGAVSILLCGLAALATWTCGKSEPFPVATDSLPTQPPPPPSITFDLSPKNVTFKDTLGTSDAAPATVNVASTGSGSVTGLTLGTITYGAGANGWLFAALNGAAAPTTLTISPSNSGLIAGTYSATVPVLANGASNNPQAVSVSFTVAPAPPPPPPSGPTVTIVATGNFGDCNSIGSNASADVVAALHPDYVFVLGDYARGPTTVTTLADFQNCYDPAWGRFKNITYAALGEHDVDGDTTSSTAAMAEGADAYFGQARVGPPGQNYFSFELGSWHVVMLNVQSGGPLRPRAIQYRAGSAQLNWLWSDLGAHPAKCTLALWHDGMWISSNDPATPTDPYPNHGYRNQPVRGVWSVLYDRNADLVINGGQHIYERFAPMRYAEGYAHPTPSEFALDSARGIRQITVGLAGDGPLATPSFIGTHPLSEVRSGGQGVLKVVLGDGSYTWEFVNTASSHITDSGSGTCH